ncbi:hypothetical protein ACQ7HM_21145 [Williamsia sp. MIQD14]|uniref:hypothetical protein n=1 Tax=Williamsia sp. MIQD14 TaxID=3425703 RepID=UPI003DA116CE
MRAEAERKIEVLEQIVGVHQSITTARDEFLTTDMANVSNLSGLIAEAEKHGVDAKLLRPFKVDPMTTGGTRRRAPGASRGRRSSTSSTTPAPSPSDSHGGESTAPVGDQSFAKSA